MRFIDGTRMLRPSGKYVYVMPRCNDMSSGKR
jgi:hypothetical protein